jgi:ankyrin repeat protein
VCACLHGHTDVVKLLLDNKCDVLDNDGFSGALHVACLGGVVDIVDLLLRNNCNINQCNTSHATPIVCACLNGCTDVVKLLIDNNCDVFDNDGFSLVLHSACEGGVVDIVDLLLR